MELRTRSSAAPACSGRRGLSAIGDAGRPAVAAGAASSEDRPALKETARQYDIPILCLCQLNRQADGDDVPRLSHLRESGAIEQDADVVLFLSKHEPTDAEPHNAALTIAKNRNGETGPLRLDWDAGRRRFSCFAGNNDFADLG